MNELSIGPLMLGAVISGALYMFLREMAAKQLFAVIIGAIPLTCIILLSNSL
jgi:hypothetical protein